MNGNDYAATRYAMQFTISIVSGGCARPVVPITALHGILEMNSL